MITPTRLPNAWTNLVKQESLGDNRLGGQALDE